MDDPKVVKRDRTFSMVCSVEVNIRAAAENVWKLLTDAADFPRWNSTVTRIEGQICEGEKLRVQVPGTKQTFNPKVSDMVSATRMPPGRTTAARMTAARMTAAHMTWTGGFAPMFKGVRKFHLRQHDDGSTDFSMVEEFSGLMLPLIKGSLPDLGPVFETYANDLKREAERSGSLSAD
jgi:hypothetical protein